ncbi:MAG: CARDB domain-containing protein [Dongiaceae bacterium]
MTKVRSLTSAMLLGLLVALPWPVAVQAEDSEIPNAAALGPVLLTKVAASQFASVVQDTIDVLSDGVGWTRAKPTRIAINLHLDAAVGDPAKWRIRQGAIVLGEADVRDGRYAPAPDDYTLKLRFAPTDHLVDSKLWAIQLDDNLAGMARDACRQNAQNLLINGMSMAEIMNAERHITMPVPFRLVLRLGYWDPLVDDKKAGAQGLYWVQSEPYNYPFRVVCHQPAIQSAGAGAFLRPPPATVATTAETGGSTFRVTEARLEVEPRSYQGECPAAMTLYPAFAAEGAGTIRYRIVDQRGNRSAEQSLALDLAAATPPTHQLAIAADGTTAGLGFSSLFRPALAALAVSPTGNPIVEGTLQLAVTSPTAIKSVVIPYSLECLAPAKPAAPEAGLAAPADATETPMVGVAPPVSGAQVAAAESAAADLVVIGVARGHTPLQVSATIANNGTAPSGPTSITLTLRRADGSTAVGLVSLGPIGPGWKQVVILDAGVPLQEADSLAVDIDAANLVPELSETNNSYRIK